MNTTTRRPYVKPFIPNQRTSEPLRTASMRAYASVLASLGRTA